MQQGSILLTGGSGRLGTELQKHIRCDAPNSTKLNILNESDIWDYYGVDLVIHAAGYTNVVKAETDKEKCFLVNAEGTINLLKVFDTTPFVYISSEYAHHPVNYYAETKRVGELTVQAYSSKYLIIRTLFKERPFPYDFAFFDQYTQGDYVDVIAELIAKAINEWDRKTCKTIYVGTGRKSILKLAEQTKPTIAGCSARLVKGVTLPLDYE